MTCSEANQTELHQCQTHVNVDQFKKTTDHTQTLKLSFIVIMKLYKLA